MGNRGKLAAIVKGWSIKPNKGRKRSQKKAKLQQRGHRTRLLTLPNELLLEIVLYLPRFHDLNSFLRVNRWLSRLLTPVLLSRAVADTSSSRAAYPGLQQRSVLHWAASHGDSSLLRKLFAFGQGKVPGLDEIDSCRYHMFPLYSAILNKHIAAVEVLLEHGADINLSCSRKTPLLLAVLGGLHDVVGLLLRAGASTETELAGVGGYLHLAVALDDPVSIRLLGCAGADLRAMYLGLTPAAMAHLLDKHAAIQALQDAELWGLREIQMSYGRSGYAGWKIKAGVRGLRQGVEDERKEDASVDRYRCTRCARVKGKSGQYVGELSYIWRDAYWRVLIDLDSRVCGASVNQ